MLMVGCALLQHALEHLVVLRNFVVAKTHKDTSLTPSMSVHLACQWEI